MTVLELMIVLAIIGGAAFLARTGFRMVTKADLVENSGELTAIMRRASQLAVTHGELHRVVIDLDKGVYVVERCQGQTAIMRNEQLRVDEDAKKRAMERGHDRMLGLPPDAFAAGDPDEATRRVTALAGEHIADKTCVPASDSITGDAKGKKWMRTLNVVKGIKFKEIWVQHMTESVTKGQVAIYFFPNSSSEKAVIELTDGDAIFSVLVYGMTGRVELRDEKLHSVDDHMLRNVMGDRDAKREDDK
jgi:type II secretory pathway pseudopilin PulG